ncbi:hypothetical protein G7050_11870 [Dysgonomonas sp. HDW5A]|uniref:hypothetical protein n=1 Tax=Dysgonomonas sp. HDW5A TaxID=2714926 RepID=UPI0014076D4E|nr:hypothetical protein [Dysgonomonas sp. HDW5A]QIK60486.1 hypothetical protein G7050_11870 [Dysgonomonas sp. HDW5A]
MMFTFKGWLADEGGTRREEGFDLVFNFTPNTFSRFTAERMAITVRTILVYTSVFIRGDCVKGYYCWFQL